MVSILIPCYISFTNLVVTGCYPVIHGGYLNMSVSYLIIRSISDTTPSQPLFNYHYALPPFPNPNKHHASLYTILFTFNDSRLLGDNRSAIINIFPRSSQLSQQHSSILGSFLTCLIKEIIFHLSVSVSFSKFMSNSFSVYLIKIH